MYNRYVPQPDGTYQKNRVPDSVQPPPGYRPQPVYKPVPEPAKEACQDPPQTDSAHMPPSKHSDATDFLRRLLPKDLDTGDLLIILLLLLMAGDCKEEKNTALLTLALYFFL